MLSVIIPCYNYGKYLNECLDSLKKQTYQDFETIIINPSSTDKYTNELLSKLPNIVTEPNTGLSDTRKHGCNLAKGKYTCILDADDTLQPTYFEECINLLESDLSVEIAYTWLQEFGDRHWLWKTEDLSNEILQHNQIPSQAVFRSYIPNHVDYWDKKYDSICEDYHFWIKCHLAGVKGKVIQKPLINYRMHGNNMSKNTKYDIIELMKAEMRKWLH